MNGFGTAFRRVFIAHPKRQMRKHRTRFGSLNPFNADVADGKHLCGRRHGKCREHGSGGHYIADMIAKEFGIKLYDKDSIEAEIVSDGYSEELIRKMDEKPVNFFTSRRIGRFSNSLEVNVAAKTFAMLRSKAAEGESFVVIGRCGEQVLANNPNCISIFICGDPQFKLNRVMNKLGLNAEQAIEEIRNVDRSRKNYHNYYCDTKWGDARGYDLTVKSNVLGCEATAEMLVSYIRRFMAQD